MRSLYCSVMLLAAAMPCVLSANEKPTADDIRAVMSELRQLRPMDRSKTYELPARGEVLAGRNDDFLRRRTAGEVVASGLTCGCGDYATVFIERMKARGYETLLVDAAQLSSASIMSQNSGHAVAAVRANENSKWWLVDSTALKVLSRDWSPTEKSFAASGYVYWIGYCGPLENYPVRSPQALRKFYAATLAKVPAEVFARTLYRFTFTLDSSYFDAGGAALNPNAARMQALHENVLRKYQISPSREISIRVVPGKNDASSNLSFSDDGEWVATIGLQSACSPNLLTSFEAKVRDFEARRLAVQP